MAETITATDPNASFMTSRNAAFMFMLSSLCPARMKIEPTLAARPSMPMNSSNRTSCTSSGGSAEQPHAGFDERVDADDQEHERADRGGEHFESRPSPGAFVAGFALHEAPR